jgi:hypothetical protein
VKKGDDVGITAERVIRAAPDDVLQTFPLVPYPGIS